MGETARRGTFLAGILGVVALAAGCVERRMVITTEPYGAVVYDETNRPIGATPVDHPFVYYGKYRFTIVKDGFQTMVVEEQVSPPWYERPGLDFVAENLIPFTIRDIRRFHYRLCPTEVVPPERVLQEGSQLRERGRTVGVPLPEATTPPVTVPAMPPG